MLFAHIQDSVSQSRWQPNEEWYDTKMSDRAQLGQTMTDINFRPKFEVYAENFSAATLNLTGKGMPAGS